MRQFVEDFALALVDAGVPRMPARVFTCLLVAQGGRLTAADLASRLGVSPAAISGAVKYLGTVGLVRRTREPGSRRDQYVVEHDAWYEATTSRTGLLIRWAEHLQRGLELVGPGTDAAERLTESRDFFLFLTEEMHQLQARWQERRRTRAALLAP